MVQWVPEYIFPLCAFKNRAHLTVLCVPGSPNQGTPQDSQKSMFLWGWAWLTWTPFTSNAPAGGSQINLFGVSLGAAVNSLVTKPNICRVWWGWSLCSFHLELANETSDRELISPYVEFCKELLLHFIFTLSFISYTLLRSLSLQAQLRIKIRCLSLGKHNKKKSPALPCSLIQAEFTLSFLWQPHFARHRHLAGVFIMTLIIRIDTF